METEYNYKVTFEFDCIGKKGNVSHKSGEINITSTVPATTPSEELNNLIVSEMERLTKKKVFNVDSIILDKKC